MVKKQAEVMVELVEAVPEPALAAPEPAQPVISAGLLAVLKDLPELCGVAVPGEVLGGVECEEGHLLVRFWPCLAQGGPRAYGGGDWELGASVLYDIDTTSPSDDPGDGSHSNVNHFARPVRFRMGSQGAYGTGGSHALGYDGNVWGAGARRGEEVVRDGSLCRGSASFSHEPFQCVMMLRMWHVQCLENRGQASKDRAATQKWWLGEEGEAWRHAYPKPKCIVVPSASAQVDKAYVVPLEAQWVEKEKKGEWKGTLWAPKKQGGEEAKVREVREGVAP